MNGKVVSEQHVYIGLYLAVARQRPWVETPCIIGVCDALKRLQYSRTHMDNERLRRSCRCSCE